MVLRVIARCTAAPDSRESLPTRTCGHKRADGVMFRHDAKAST